MLSKVNNFLSLRKKKKPLYMLMKTIPMFSSLNSKDIKKLERILHLRNYDKGEIIFRENTPAHGVFIIREGSVSITKERDDGKTEEVEVMKPGSFIGELALFSNLKRRVSASALEDCEIVAFFKHDFLDLIDEYPALGIKVLLEISTNISQRYIEMVDNNTVSQQKGDEIKDGNSSGEE